MKNVKMLAIMHMHNRMNLDNWTTPVLTNAGRVFDFLLIPTSSGYLNKFSMSQRIVGSGYLKIFRTKEPPGKRFHETAYPKALGGYLILKKIENHSLYIITGYLIVLDNHRYQS
jgi:hypothetical protein